MKYMSLFAPIAMLITLSSTLLTGAEDSSTTNEVFFYCPEAVCQKKNKRYKKYKILKQHHNQSHPNAEHEIPPFSTFCDVTLCQLIFRSDTNPLQPKRPVPFVLETNTSADTKTNSKSEATSSNDTNLVSSSNEGTDSYSCAHCNALLTGISAVADHQQNCQGKK